MVHYFFQDVDKSTIKEQFLTGDAVKWAKSFIFPSRPSEKFHVNPKLNSAQLRKFHNEAKELEERIKNLADPEKDFVKIRPMVKMLKSKVAYACPSNGRDRKVPEEFRKFIEVMVDNIEDHKDFRAFALCFEAVVGFFYGEGGR